MIAASPENAAMVALEAGQISSGGLAEAILGDRDRLLSEIYQLRAKIVEKDHALALSAQMIETMQAVPLEKIQPGDLDRLDTILIALRSDPRPIWGACIASLERVLANVREATR